MSNKTHPDTIRILQGRSKRLDGYSYKLMDNQFGLDVVISDENEIDESNFAISIPFADSTRRDGVGDLLEVAGINTDRHRLNPVILFDHGKRYDLPVALAEDPITHQYTVTIDPNQKKAWAKAFFYTGKNILPDIDKEKSYDHALFCEQLFDMMCKRYIRAGSIGYQVIYAKQLSPDYETGTPQGLHLLSVLMLECSAVVMPANADTVRKALAQPTICGHSLSPMLVKCLTPFASTKKAMLGYEPVKAIASYANTSNYQEGETVFAREYLSFVDPTTRKTEPYAKTGDRLKVTNVSSSGLIEVTRKDGVRASFSSAQLRKGKSLKNIGKGMDLSEIRLKYRTTKGLRRRLKKSSSGSSMIHVRGKDLETVKKLATDKGLKCQYMGTHPSGLEKVKLIGDDSHIDTVAKQFGRSLKKSGVKSMKVKIKEIPAEMEEKDFDTENNPLADDSTPEPLGAQAVRRMHEDHSILMGDYHEILQQVEQEEVKKLMEKKLASIEADLTEFESTFESVYSDLPGIDGAIGVDEKELDEEGDEEEKDLDDGEETGEDELDEAALPADSAEEEEVTPEEAVEGMRKGPNKKHLRNGKVKTLPAKKKCMKCGKPGCSCKSMKKKDLTQKEAGQVEDDIDAVSEEVQEQTQDTEKDKSMPLDDDEKKVVGKANNFMKSLQDKTSLEDEDRMKSYHYHKALEPIAGIEDEEEMKSQESYPGEEADRYSQLDEDEKRIRRKEMDDEEEMKRLKKRSKGAGQESYPGEEYDQYSQIDEDDKSMHPHRVKCMGACKFLKDLSTERAFGENHRMEAMKHAKNMDEIMTQDDKGMEDPTESPDQMGEIDSKMFKEVKRRASLLRDLESKLAGIK